MPVPGSYFRPRSMCSEIPKPKDPLALKFFLRSSYSFTFRPFSRISSAFSPRTVTWHAIFSFRRMPNERTVYRALEKTGACSVSCSSTLAARVSLSPLSPTEMLMTSFSMRIDRMGLSDLSAMVYEKGKKQPHGTPVLEPNQKAKAHYRRAMARPSHLAEEKLKDCELGLAEHAGNTEMRQLRQQLKDELKKAARKSGMAKGFLARGEIVADVVNAPDTQDAEEQRATETFDSVADDLRDMCIDDPEKFKQLKEKLRQMCEENDALPPKDWS
eukprot:GEMP01068242.1.p1 GENE.GEMP01068242.1~~GEMP01068242.1.p1  ORF type:complete len:272 (+),score=65.20 GEMP01068242.1:280-1095(+)